MCPICLHSVLLLLLPLLPPLILASARPAACCASQRVVAKYRASYNIRNVIPVFDSDAASDDLAGLPHEVAEATRALRAEVGESTMQPAQVGAMFSNGCNIALNLMWY
jgi:hypothetical protein